MFTLEKASSASLPEKKCMTLPFSEMGVGDVMKVPELDRLTKFHTQVSAHSAARVRGWKFKTKTINGVLHIWRVE